MLNDDFQGCIEAGINKTNTPEDFFHDAINHRDVLSIVHSWQSFLFSNFVDLGLCRLDHLGVFGHHLQEGRHYCGNLHARSIRRDEFEDE